MYLPRNSVQHSTAQHSQHAAIIVHHIVLRDTAIHWDEPFRQPSKHFLYPLSPLWAKQAVSDIADGIDVLNSTGARSCPG